MKVLKHGTFGRIQARELSPAIATPVGSPVTARKSGGVKSHVDSPLAKRKEISKKKSSRDDNDESDNSSEESIEEELEYVDHKKETSSSNRDKFEHSSPSTPERSPTPTASPSTVRKRLPKRVPLVSREATPKKESKVVAESPNAKKKELKVVLTPTVKKKVSKKSDILTKTEPDLSESPKGSKKESKKSKLLETIASEEVIFDINKLAEKSPSSGSGTPITTPTAVPRGRQKFSREKSIVIRSPTHSTEGKKEKAATGVPRTPPQPRPRVVIRQSSVMLHVHELTETSREPIPSPVKPKPIATKEAGSKMKNLESADKSLLTKPVKKRRPSSAPSNREKKIPTEPVDPSIDLRSFSKSLKLLGLEIPSNRREATKLDTHEVKIKTNSPSMRTRLSRRTQSVSDLREQVDSKHSMPKSEYISIKEPLGRAVFEAWYFQKLREDQDRRKAKTEAEEAQIQKQKEEEEEKKDKAVHEYAQWLEEKKLAYKKSLRRKQRKDTNKEKETEERMAKIKKAEAEWKVKKLKEKVKADKKAAKIAQKKFEEKLKLEQKHEESEKQFVKWKETMAEKLKAKMQAEKQAKLDILDKKRRDATEKKEVAQLAFNAWKNKKDEKRKKQLQHASKHKANTEVKPVDKEAKLQEAREAYEAWLEYVEQREEEQRFEEEERQLRDMWRPPWYPAGKSDM